MLSTESLIPHKEPGDTSPKNRRSHWKNKRFFHKKDGPKISQKSNFSVECTKSFLVGLCIDTDSKHESIIYT
jgi:hypothetical protein